MGTQSATQLNVPGLLIAAPSTAAQASAYGGTILGTAQAVFLEPRPRFEPITAEELGGDVIDEIHLGEELNLYVRFAGSQNDTLDRILYTSTSGVASIPGTFGAGSLLSSKAFALLFAPEDSAQKAVYLYRAVPKHDRLRPAFSGYTPHGWDVRFLAVEDASGNKAEIGPVASIQSAWGA